MGGNVQRLGGAAAAELQRALGGGGLYLDLGALVLRIRSDSQALARQLGAVYRDFPLDVGPRWADVHADISIARGLRRWVRPQVQFRCDGAAPFDPFPADSPLPLLEWGTNWLIGKRLNDLLLLHAGTLVRDGLALVMPATPGSGKSTLAAALSLRGWRLLSDEFGAWDPSQEAFVAVLKPIALKNRSIEVIREFEPSAPLGPLFPNTRKGTVAHLAADARSIAGARVAAPAGAVIFPRWREGAAARLERVDEDEIFPALAYNAFNYSVLGELAFDACIGMARNCPGWRLEYSRLDDAIALIEGIWQEVRSRHAGCAAGVVVA